MEAVVLFLAIAFLILLIRLIAHGMDRSRIESYLQKRKGTLLRKEWTPFGKGWFGERDARIYKLKYRDRHGNIREASCKTGLFSGVYFTEDRVVPSAGGTNSKQRNRKHNDAEHLERNENRQDDCVVSEEEAPAQMTPRERELQAEVARLRDELERSRNGRG